MACCTVRCACSAAARLKRACAPSCGLTMPWNRPAGLPEASMRRRLGAVDDACCASPVRPARGGGTAGQAGADDQRVALAVRRRCRAATAGRETRAVDGAQFGRRPARARSRRCVNAGRSACSAGGGTQPGQRRGQARQALGQPQRRTLRVGRSIELVDQELIDLRAQLAAAHPAAGPRPAAGAPGRRRRPGGAGCAWAAATAPRSPAAWCKAAASGGQGVMAMKSRRAGRSGPAASCCQACRKACPRPKPSCRHTRRGATRRSSAPRGAPASSAEGRARQLRPRYCSTAGLIEAMASCRRCACSARVDGLRQRLGVDQDGEDRERRRRAPE